MTQPRVVLLATAAALTLLNAVKPLHIDDPFIYRVAEQVVHHPLDPFGLDMLWVQWPTPVVEELTPPLVPYWWAIALAVAPAQPLLWKLWLLPFALLLVFALHALLRRFARGVELPLTVLTALSPAVLPGFNLMQDVPALALALSALALFLAARPAAAGGIGGLALQTKYTAAAILPVMALRALLTRRLRPALIAVPLAVLVFLGWEVWVTTRYGTGMFVGQLRSDVWWYARAAMVLPLLQLLAGAAPLLVPLGLAALGASRAIVLAATALVAGAYALPLLWPVERDVFLAL
ncbi:MAG TPA: hypothetical protein VJS92_15610, partial [Candidatus Polarisedimenticolaceae bacterium]|nr:hypothetical protein [Candidatus Polarisedimenticolaceae bacterium]